MVFFTCNACGTSLKKNQVEKHYQNECRNCEVLSCMDCGKDFYGDEYASHTKCISEAEKYQGALFKESGGGGVTKGEKKQQEWLEKVRQSKASAKVPGRITSLLERIAEYPNIPRKKKKFENFVRNSINVRDQATLTQLWDAFNEATKVSETPVHVNGSQPGKGLEQSVDKSSTEETTKMVDGQAETDPENDKCVPKKKKKKSKKQKEEISTSSESPAICNGSLELNGTPEHTDLEKPSKQKRKKDKHSPHDTAEQVALETPKKKKKKKHKVFDNEKTSNSEDTTGIKKKRKRAHSGKEETEERTKRVKLSTSV